MDKQDCPALSDACFRREAYIPFTGPSFALGLFFWRQIRSYTYMGLELENVIRQALEDALLNGRGHMAQTVLAVQAVLKARPDMTAAEALAAVNLIQHKLPPDSTSTTMPKLS